MKEALALASGKNFGVLSQMECAPLQKHDMKHPKTGIEVTTRFQYTPLQLMKMLSQRGFEVIDVFPIHIHGVPPVFAKKHPEVHALISNLLQAHADQNREFIPFASSFMLNVQKREL
jgi:hypothetical protein